jgi:nucleotide-binding universal stress UspA family protein
MIKDMLVNLLIGDDQNATADFAITVARVFNSHLTGVALSVDPFVPGSIFEDTSAAAVATYWEEEKENAKVAASKFEKALTGTGVSGEARVMNVSAVGVGETFGRLARKYDLSVVSQPRNDDPARQLAFEGALFSSGRPVLVVPYIQKDEFTPERVMLCWDESQNAARAFGDALPFLEQSKKIEVITIAVKDDNQGEISGVDIAHHLARHGLNVDLKRIVAPDADVANTILSHAADSSTNLIVMGGYGHSRLREFVLGGATRAILGSMTVPTLMSH